MSKNGQWANRIVGYAEVDPESILANSANWRVHPKNQQDALSGILSDVGLVQSIIINRRTSELWGPNDRGVETLVDGHLRVQLALSKGQKAIPAVFVDLSPSEEAEVLATIDPVAALAVADKEQLDSLLREVSSSDEAVQRMLAELAKESGLLYLDKPKAEDPGAQIDKAEELREKWGTETGQLWLCGKHRVIIGDSTDGSVIKELLQGEQIKMVFTDPPYGVAYSGRGQSTQQQTIENDDLNLPELRRFLSSAFNLWDKYMATGCVLYVCHADRPRGTRPVFEGAFTDAGWKFSATIIWVKQAASMGWQDYRAQHEPLLYGWKTGDHYYCDDRSQTTVWEINRDAAATYRHPTQKPVELAERAVVNSSKEGWIIFDGFLGGGTTLVACERQNRICRAVEIDPGYAAVALQRWEDLTGEKAVLLAPTAALQGSGAGNG